jgi:hypothetical protein
LIVLRLAFSGSSTGGLAETRWASALRARHRRRLEHRAVATPSNSESCIEGHIEADELQRKGGDPRYADEWVEVR